MVKPAQTIRLATINQPYQIFISLCIIWGISIEILRDEEQNNSLLINDPGPGKTWTDCAASRHDPVQPTPHAVAKLITK